MAGKMYHHYLNLHQNTLANVLLNAGNQLNQVHISN